jgi:FAD/FMN-containing dehydrogenase
MATGISGTRIRKELSKHIPAHRLSQSDAFRLVTVQPDNPQELHTIVGFAARKGVPVVPSANSTHPPAMDDWHIRLSFGRLSAITDFSLESGLVCAQAGTRIQDLADWLMEKGYSLMTRPDAGEDMDLWEYLLSPDAGNFGPRFGSKWEQVFSLSAVLPSGRIFENSMAPARASGPDFSRIILLGRGAFGIPLEVYLKVRPLPRRRQLTAFAINDLPLATERAWKVAEAAQPEFMEIAVNRLSDSGKVPEQLALIELWGERTEVSRRKELVRKHFGDAATATEIPYEVLLGLEDSCRFERDTRAQFFANREGIAALVGSLGEFSREDPPRLRVRGFAHDQACVTMECRTDMGTAPVPAKHAHYASTDGDWLLREAARHLDPPGIFSWVPRVWDEEG